jgi:hypothetical protein
MIPYLEKALDEERKLWEAGVRGREMDAACRKVSEGYVIQYPGYRPGSFSDLDMEIIALKEKLGVYR